MEGHVALMSQAELEVLLPSRGAPSTWIEATSFVGLSPRDACELWLLSGQAASWTCMLDKSSNMNYGLDSVVSGSFEGSWPQSQC